MYSDRDKSRPIFLGKSHSKSARLISVTVSMGRRGGVMRHVLFCIIYFKSLNKFLIFLHGALFMHFGSKKTGQISIVFEAL